MTTNAPNMADPNPKPSSGSKATPKNRPVPSTNAKASTSGKLDPMKETNTNRKTKSATKPKGKGRATAVPESEAPVPVPDDEPISLEWGRQKLESELNRTQEELAHLRAAMYSEVDVDPEEGDVEVSERLKNVTLIAMLEKRETALQESLSAIVEGSYGICNRCKKSIGRERLEARPDAKYCVHCQGEIERAARRLR